MILYFSKEGLALDKKMLFLFNPHSGKAQIKNKLCDLVDVFTKGGYDVLVHPTQYGGDARDISKEYAEKCDMIVCSGGDGTVNEVVSGLMEHETRPLLGYIPSGTVNDFAASLGLSGNMMKAAQSIMEGQPFAYDVGGFNGRYFNYIAAFGLFTDVAYQTPQQAKNVWGRLAYLMEGAKQIWNIPSYRTKVEYDGKVIEDHFFVGLISNSISVGGFRAIVGNRNVLLDDGLFEVTLIRTPKNIIDFQNIINALLRKDEDCEWFYSFSAKDLRISFEEPVPWTLDGEYGGDQLEVSITNFQKAVQIVVPNQPTFTETPVVLEENLSDDDDDEPEF